MAIMLRSSGAHVVRTLNVGKCMIGKHGANFFQNMLRHSSSQCDESGETSFVTRVDLR